MSTWYQLTQPFQKKSKNVVALKAHFSQWQANSPSPVTSLKPHCHSYSQS